MKISHDCKVKYGYLPRRVSKNDDEGKYDSRTKNVIKMFILDTTHDKTRDIYALDTTQSENTNHHSMSGTCM